MRLIDADALTYHFGEVDDNDTKDWRLFITDEEVAEQPTIEAVPVIRCKDCKWWKAEKEECYEWYDSPYAPADGYCFRAERREDDRNNDI